MAEVKVLIEGYGKEIKNGWIASSTTTLIKLDNKNIIVDPGCNRQKLLDVLTDNNLKTDDIDYILLTHNHLDHIVLVGIFEKAQVVGSSEIYKDDYQVEHEGKISGLQIKILKTPGHSTDSRSFIVKIDNTTYAIAGDLFWWADSEKQKTDFDSLIAHEDPYAGDTKILEKSRQMILDMADYIIPGHGKMWKVEKQINK